MPGFGVLVPGERQDDGGGTWPGEMNVDRLGGCDLTDALDF
jgi:hypothetical protein